jgi:hypothetical protein
MSRDNWQTFAELGWLSIPFAEEHGGFGGGAVDTMVMMEQFGKGLVLEPYLRDRGAVRWPAAAGGTEAQQASTSPQVIEGSCLGAFAYLERQSRFELADVKTTARRDGRRLPAARRESCGVQRRQRPIADRLGTHRRRAVRRGGHQPVPGACGRPGVERLSVTA